MNLGTMRSRIASKIGMSTAEELALIDGWLNEGVEQYLVETKNHVREAELALINGVSDYALPVQVLSFAGIWIAPADGSDTQEYSLVGTSDMLRARRAGYGGRTYQILGYDLLRINPAGATGDFLHLLYVPLPTPMVADADTPTTSGVPVGDHPAIEAYGSWKAADWDDDTSSKVGQDYRAEWEQAIRRGRARRNRLGGGWGPAVPGRRRYIPPKPGTDIGW